MLSLPEKQDVSPIAVSLLHDGVRILHQNKYLVKLHKYGVIVHLIQSDWAEHTLDAHQQGQVHKKATTECSQ